MIHTAKNIQVTFVSKWIRSFRTVCIRKKPKVSNKHPIDQENAQQTSQPVKEPQIHRKKTSQQQLTVVKHVKIGFLHRTPPSCAGICVSLATARQRAGCYGSTEGAVSNCRLWSTAAPLLWGTPLYKIGPVSPAIIWFISDLVGVKYLLGVRAQLIIARGPPCEHLQTLVKKLDTPGISHMRSAGDARMGATWANWSFSSKTCSICGCFWRTTIVGRTTGAADEPQKQKWTFFACITLISRISHFSIGSELINGVNPYCHVYCWLFNHNIHNDLCDQPLSPLIVASSQFSNHLFSHSQPLSIMKHS